MSAPTPDAGPQVIAPEAAEEFLSQAERRIRAHGKRAIDAIVEIGLELVDVKAKVGWKGYVAFVTERLGWSETQGDRLLAVGKMFGTPNLGVDPDKLHLDASSLYLLAAPSTPATVRETVLERAAQPAGISHEDVARLVRDAREDERKEAQEKLQMQTALLEGQIEELQNTLEISAEVARGEIAAEYEGKLVLTEAELFERVESAVAPTKARIEALEREREGLKESLDKSYAAAAEAGKKRAEDAPGVRFPDSTLSYRAMCVLQAIQSLKDELKITPPQCVQAERELAAFHKQPAEKLAPARSNAIAIMSWLTEFLDVCDRDPDPEPEPVETPIAATAELAAVDDIKVWSDGPGPVVEGFDFTTVTIGALPDPVALDDNDLVCWKLALSWAELSEAVRGGGAAYDQYEAWADRMYAETEKRNPQVGEGVYHMGGWPEPKLQSAAAEPVIAPEEMAEIERAAAVVYGASEPEENRLFVLWQTLKSNTRGRCLVWVEENCPTPFALLDDVHTIRESAAPFRSLAKECTEAELDQFIAMTKAAV